jgi:hypothetical protein
MTDSEPGFEHSYSRTTFSGGAPMRSRSTVIAGLIAAIVVVGVVVGVLWFVLRTEHDPQQVFVALQGWPAGTEGAAREALETELRNNGLVLVKALPAGDKTTLEQVAHAAADAGAAHALWFKIEVLDSRPGIGPGQVFVLARVSGQGMSLGTAGSDRERQIELVEQRPTLGEALGGIGADAVRILVQELMADIVATEVVQAFARAEPHTLSSDQQRDANTLFERKEDAVEMLNAAAGFAKQCERATNRLADERGAARVRCYGDPCAEEYAVDLFAGGERALVQVEQKRWFYFLNRPTRERAALVPERLDLISLASGTRQVLDTAKNYFGFASAAPSGDRVHFVENYGRQYALVELVIGTGERRVLQSFERPERIAFPRMSPDGKHIAVLYRKGSEQYRAMVMEQGGPLVQLTDQAYHHSWVEVPIGTGGRQSLVAVIVLGVGEPDEDRPEDFMGIVRRPPFDQLLLFEPGGERFATIGGVDWPVTGVLGAQGYDVYFSSNDASGCRIGIYDTANAETELIPARACLSSATLAPDGSVLGLTSRTRPRDPYGPDVELVRLEPRSGVVSRLTDNELVEREVTAARGRHVLFEKAPERFHVDFPLVNVCAADLLPSASLPALDIPDASVEEPDAGVE